MVLGESFKLPRLKTSLQSKIHSRVHLAPNRNNDEKAEILNKLPQNGTKNCVDRTPDMAEYCLQKVVVCKLHYLLVATTLTETQCNNGILKPLLAIGLPTTRPGMHVPLLGATQDTRQQGLNFLQLHMEQTVA